MSADQGPPPASRNGQLWNDQLMNNPSYNISDNDNGLQLMSNQSYNYSDINQRDLSGNPGQTSTSVSVNRLMNNPSYNIGDNDLQLSSNYSYASRCDNPMLVRNQAYNQLQTPTNDPELVNNPAYNTNQEDPYYSVIHDH